MARFRMPGVDAVLFDRDGTLIEDVPGNADPARVHPMPGAAEGVALAREAGVGLGVVTNQAAIGNGVLSPEEVDRVNARVDAMLGPFDVWEVCPHRAEDGCWCRKPRAGMILSAARRMGVDPARVVVVGDIGSDVEAADAAGASAILVPTGRTRPEEIRNAPRVASSVYAAVSSLLAPANPAQGSDGAT